MNYEEFLIQKRHTSNNYGIDCNYIPEGMFDFQKYITEYAVKKGRCAVFVDTGLGKTIIELATAVNYVRHTNRPVLILTPLAVAYQFIKEADLQDCSKFVNRCRRLVYTDLLAAVNCSE